MEKPKHSRLNSQFSFTLQGLNARNLYSSQSVVGLNRQSQSISRQQNSTLNPANRSAIRKSILRKPPEFTLARCSLSHAVVGVSVKASKHEKPSLHRLIGNVLARQPLKPSKPPRTVDLKYLAFVDFMGDLRSSNAVALNSSSSHYHYFIGGGNNSSLVRKALTKRWWWTSAGSIRQSNFIWTSVKSQKALSLLPSSSKNEAAAQPIPKAKATVALLQTALGYDDILKSELFKPRLCRDKLNPSALTVYNKLAQNKELCSKKRLFKNLQLHCSQAGLDVFTIVPLTFHIAKNKEAFLQFSETYSRIQREGGNNMWIIKPGECTNRGLGISVSQSFEEISRIVASQDLHTTIIQKYIDRPLLVHRRKFDMRVYGLLTSVNGCMQGYYYKEGYIRTSSYEYTTGSFNRFIHLTNDAIQKHSNVYGKYESGNKLSYQDLRAYLGDRLDLDAEILPRIRDIVARSFKSVAGSIDAARKKHCFELFGYDFMIDEEFHVWLIEANTNPCLEESCELLGQLLPDLIDNTFRVVLDPLFPPPCDEKLRSWAQSADLRNNFELVFSE